MVALIPDLTTQFHRDLAAPEWLASLAAHIGRALASHREYQTSDATGIVFSGYNEDRYMGPNSVCKFFFVVDALVVRRNRTLDRDRYQAWLRYEPRTGTFRTRSELIETRELLEAVAYLEAQIKAAPSKQHVDRLACPWCASEISIQFSPSGDSFEFRCGRHGHFFRSVAVSEPPSWWREALGVWRRLDGADDATA